MIKLLENSISDSFNDIKSVLEAEGFEIRAMGEAIDETKNRFTDDTNFWLEWFNVDSLDKINRNYIHLYHPSLARSWVFASKQSFINFFNSREKLTMSDIPKLIEGTSEVKITDKEKLRIRKRSGIPPSSPELNQPNQLYSQDSYSNYGHTVTENLKQSEKEQNDAWYVFYGSNLIKHLHKLYLAKTNEESIEASTLLRKALKEANKHIDELSRY